MYIQVNLPQIVVNTPSHTSPLTSTLSPDLQKIGRVLKGGNIPSIAKAVFAHQELQKCITAKFLDVITAECSVVCRKNPSDPSPFRRIGVEHLREFTLEAFIQELKTHAPTLFQIASVIASHNDHKNQSKKGSQHHPGICMALAVLLKERNREMCGLQTVVSVALFNSRVQKKVHVHVTVEKMLMHTQCISSCK